MARNHDQKVQARPCDMLAVLWSLVLTTPFGTAVVISIGALLDFVVF